MNTPLPSTRSLGLTGRRGLLAAPHSSEGPGQGQRKEILSSPHLGLLQLSYSSWPEETEAEEPLQSAPGGGGVGGPRELGGPVKRPTEPRRRAPTPWPPATWSRREEQQGTPLNGTGGVAWDLAGGNCGRSAVPVKSHKRGSNFP